MSAVVVLASEAEHHASTATIVWSLIAAAVLILLNGFFVAWEFAILAAKRAKFEADADARKRPAKAAIDAFGDLGLQLAGAQFGITMATLVLGFVGEPAIDALILNVAGDAIPEEIRTGVAFAIALAIVSFLHLVVGEMIPKNIAISAAEPTVRWLVMPYRAYLAIVGPVVRMLNWFANVGCRLFGVEPRDEIVAAHSVAELTAIVAQSTQEGAIEAESGGLLRGALDFAQRPVGDLATPLDDVTSIRLGATAVQAERAVMSSGQTRLPVVAPALGAQRYVGYLHAKDLFTIEPDERSQPIPQRLTRTMAVLREDEPLVEALRLLRRRRRHLAVVVGDDGPSGLVSVEDLVRALVESDGEVDPAALAAVSGGHH